MHHDGVFSRASARARSAHHYQPSDSTADLCIDRRASDRLPFPAELVLAWNHDLATPMRYRIIDAGDGGFRIHSSLPILEGTTGIALRILPGGKQPLNQAVMVVWAHPSEDLNDDRGEHAPKDATDEHTAGQRNGYDVGLRFF